MNHIKRYIITGAPGTGKSSVIELLRRKGYHCFDEVSRTVISEQQNNGGNLLPWENLEGFANVCCYRMHEQLNNALPGINIYDRALPDIIAYLKNGGIDQTTHYINGIEHYQKSVLYFPIWESIYTNDPQRPEPLAHAKAIDYHLRNTYNSLGFQLIEIPKKPIIERMSFIEQQLI